MNTTEPENQKFRTVREVATELRMSLAGVYNLVDAGKIDAYRIGRKVLIPAAAVDRLLSKSRVHAKESA